MDEKKFLCHKCKHNIKNTSCGDKIGSLIKNISEATDLKIAQEDNDVEFLKLTCKIVMKYPEEKNAINPMNCKYYLNAALRFN